MTHKSLITHDLTLKMKSNAKIYYKVYTSDVDFIISHNIQTEKNLLKMYLPFPKKKIGLVKFEVGTLVRY